MRCSVFVNDFWHVLHTSFLEMPGPVIVVGTFNPEAYRTRISCLFTAVKFVFPSHNESKTALIFGISREFGNSGAQTLKMQ